MISTDPNKKQSMKLSFKEGQTFSDRLTMVTRLSENEQAETWLAIDSEKNERVSIKLFKQPLNESVANEIKTAVAIQKDLYHPNIARTYECGSHEGIDYLISQLPEIMSPGRKNSDNLNFFDASQHLSSAYECIKKILDALEYAHSLDLADGHLRPQKILITAQNEPVIIEFGLPVPIPEGSEDWNYISPQVREGHSADKSDDIYSIGQLLHWLVAKRFWNQNDSIFQSDIPVADSLVALITKMLSPVPYKRPDNISTVKELLDQSLNPVSSKNIIEPIFSRTTEASVHPDLSYVSDGSSQKPVFERKTIKASSALLAIGLLIIFSGTFFYFVSLVQTDIKDGSKPIVTIAGIEQSADVSDSGVVPANRVPANRAPDKEQADESPAPYELAKLQHAKEESKKTADNLIRYQLKLEAKGVQVWAAREYQQTMLLAQEGDDLYRNGDYLAALKKYNSSMELLGQIENSMHSVLSSHQIMGDNSLKKGDHQSAIEAFTIVTTIIPEDTLAKSKLERAENLNAVVELTSQATTYEYQNMLSKALELYQRASMQDPLWTPAKDGVDRVAQLITDRRFSDTMSEGFNSLANKRYDLAKEAFQKAQSLMPASTEPKDGLVQVEVAEQSERIDKLRIKASLSDKEERWNAAVETYAELLMLDSSLSFAHSGKKTADMRLKIDRDLQKYISHPEIMQKDEELTSAKRAVYDASKLGANSPKLKSQLSRLSMLVSQARTPLSLKIQSDNKTNIIVYKVDQLGRFTEKVLNLIPGSYTVVGKRSGYRDVQRKVTLLAGSKSNIVFIACEEKI